MNKKCIGPILAVLLSLSLVFVLVSCVTVEPNDGTYPTEFDWDGKPIILTIGDSIAEAIAGPSPLSERENYGYYALVGKGNGFTYINKSVSGWKSNQLLDYIAPSADTPIDDEHQLFLNLVSKADFVQVSILGNDLLQDNLGKLLVMYKQYTTEVASGNAESKALDYINDILFNDVYEYDKYTPLEKSLGKVTGRANPYNSTDNFAKIINAIKSYNPDAKIIVQTIYNPVFETSSLVLNTPIVLTDENGYGYFWNDDSRSIRTILREDYGVTEDQYRQLGYELIEMMNSIIRDYVEANPTNMILVDVFNKAEEYYQADNSDYKALSRRLYSQDYIHPSNEGHAFIADCTQEALVELGLGNNVTYIANLKAVRCAQIDRLYSYQGCVVNAEQTKSAINAATTSREVNKAYFDAITDSTYYTAINNYFSTGYNALNDNDPKVFYPWVIPNYAENK